MSRKFWVRLVSLDDAGAQVIHDFGTHPFQTTVFGTVPVKNVLGRLDQPGLLRRDMYGPGRTMGDSEISAGVISLSNSDTKLDYLKNYSFDGQSFQLLEYQLGWGGEWALIRAGYIEQPSFDDQQVVFQVRDVQHAFDVPLLANAKYAGTNVLPAGVEGTASDIKGQPKPAVYGTVFNVPPVCVNTSKQIWQVDGRRGLHTGFTLAVYDKRSALTRGADYTSQADVEGNAPTAGQYRVWPVGGMFRTNAAHTLLTYDCFNPPSPGTTDAIDDVLNGIIDTAPGVPGFHFGPFLAATPAAGIYVQDERTKLAVLNEVGRSVGAFFTTGRTPAVSVGVLATDVWGSHLTDPAALPYTAVLDPIELTVSSSWDLKRVPPNEPTRGLPVWRVNLKYGKNYRVMNETDLAGVALSELAIWSQEYRTVTVEDASVKTKWPNAPELNLVTLLVDATEATAEANRVLSLFSAERDMYTLKMPGDKVPRINSSGASREYFQIGTRVLLYADRYDLAGGKLFLIIGMEEDPKADTYALTLWG